MAIVAYSGYDLPALAPVAAGGEVQRRALRAAVGAAAPWAEASTVQQAEEARLAAPISKARLIDLYLTYTHARCGPRGAAQAAES